MRANFILILLLLLFSTEKNNAKEKLKDECKTFEEVLDTFIWSETKTGKHTKNICHKVIFDYPDCSCLMQAYNVLGFLLYNVAEKSWLNALTVKNPKNKIRENDGYAYQNLARVYIKKGALEKSLDYVERAKKVWLDLGHYKGLYLLALHEAGTLIETKNYRKALSQLKKGRAYGDTAKVSLLKGEYYLTEGKIYQLLKDEANEITSLKEALNYSVELDLHSIEHILNRLTAVQNNNGNIDANSIFLTAFERLKQQNEINTRKKISSEKNLSVEIEKKEKGEVIIKRQSLFLLAMASCLILFLLLIVWIVRQNARAKRLNQEILASHKIIENQIEQLKEKNLGLKNFAYVASHDLKSPLNTIAAFAGLIEKKLHREDNNIKKYIYYIRQSTNSMTEMITSLLNHSTTEKGIVIESNLIKNIIDEAVQNLNNKIEHNDAKLIFDKISPSPIYCDKSKFVQLIQNLISNAITYSKENVQPFEMFKQLKTKGNTKGSGIGLATCKKIVELHKGDISVQSKMNEGSVFTINIPQEEYKENSTIQQLSKNHLPKLPYAATI